jgi:hypothetical protein
MLAASPHIAQHIKNFDFVHHHKDCAPSLMGAEGNLFIFIFIFAAPEKRASRVVGERQNCVQLFRV